MAKSATSEDKATLDHDRGGLASSLIGFVIEYSNFHSKGCCDNRGKRRLFVRKRPLVRVQCLANAQRLKCSKQRPWSAAREFFQDDIRSFSRANVVGTSLYAGEDGKNFRTCSLRVQRSAWWRLRGIHARGITRWTRLTACDYSLQRTMKNMMAAPTTVRGQAAKKWGRTPDTAARPLPRRGGSARAGSMQVERVSSTLMAAVSSEDQSSIGCRDKSHHVGRWMAGTWTGCDRLRLPGQDGRLNCEQRA